jgi:hypothetical protein
VIASDKVLSTLACCRCLSAVVGGGSVQPNIVLDQTEVTATA